MRKVVPAAEPPAFDELVRRPGLAALQELVNDPNAPKRRGPKRKQSYATVNAVPASLLPDHWTRALPELRRRYAHTCAYLGLRLDPATTSGTVDHFVAKERDRTLAYEWTNYRFASTAMNSHKHTHDDVIDPFTIEDGWFVLDFGTFELSPEPSLSEALKAQIRATISRLKLNDPVYCEVRQAYHDRYFGLMTDPADGATPWPWAYVALHAPYVAAELRRQGRVRADGV